MSRTTRHTINAKFRNGLIKLVDVPENIYSGWNRINFDWGRHRARKQKLIEQSHESANKEI